MTPYLEKTEDGLKITAEGQGYLSNIVTDPTGKVYAFKPQASPLAVAAAMARLSRSANDLRVTYLNEFAGNEEGIDRLVKKVVTEYGDDSVQQLLPVAVVVEDVSNLGTKQVELGRLAAYLEQSTRYIFFDQKRDGRFKYLVPEEFQGSIRQRYVSDMDLIFSHYSVMVRGVTDFLRLRGTEPTEAQARQAWLNATRAQACDAVRPVLPCSTQSTVGIVASAQAIDNMLMRLASEDIMEFQQLGTKILAQVRQVAPVFFERTDLPDRGDAKSVYRRDNRNRMRKIAAELGLRNPIRTTHNGYDDPTRVTLIDYWPQNELKLATNCLYDLTKDASFEAVERVVNGLSRARQEEILRAYIGERLNRRHRPGRAFERAHYEWEVLGDYGTFRDLQRHRMVDDWVWPELTPTHGYVVPELVIEAGFQHLFEECFKISQRLYDFLCARLRSIVAQYAVLLGHLMRYHFLDNAREAYHIHELRTTPQGHPGYRKIVLEMHRQLSEVHPIIASGMIFVGQKDTPELIRLDSELATARKLASLGE